MFVLCTLSKHIRHLRVNAQLSCPPRPLQFSVAKSRDMIQSLDVVQWFTNLIFFPTSHASIHPLVEVNPGAKWPWPNSFNLTVYNTYYYMSIWMTSRWQVTVWAKSSLSHDKVIKMEPEALDSVLINSKLHVYPAHPSFCGSYMYLLQHQGASITLLFAY